MITPPNVILIGAMGAGKTSTGTELSRIIHFNFWDMDQWIERKNNKKIKDIFGDQGESFFREQEVGAVNWLKDKKHLVISTGGGVWVENNNRARLLEMGWCVWLRVSAKEAISRVGPNLEQRPLLALDPAPLSTLEKIMNKRDPLYSLAHAKVETDGKSPKEVALEIHRLLLESKPFDLPQAPK